MSDEVPSTNNADASSEQTSAASDETTGSSRPEGREAVSEDGSSAPKFVERVKSAFGKDIIEIEENYGDLIVRLTKDGYANAPLILRDQLGLEYLTFISGIDWMPMPMESEEGSGDTSQPAQPQEMTFGITGSDSRFQVFSHAQSTSSNLGLTIKVDVDETEMQVASWTSVYPGADWHERECWEMYGIDFIGHPEIRHLYLPGEFEGNPLRKDFPLLARIVKPWPGLVDVEPMPGEDASESESESEND